MTGDNDRFAIHNRSYRAVRAARLPRMFPKRRAVRDRDADDAFIRHRHNLANASQLDDDGRRIDATAVRRPTDGPCVCVISSQRTVTAGVEHDQFLFADG